VPWDGSLLKQEIPERAGCPEPGCLAPAGARCGNRPRRTGRSHYARMLAAYGKPPAVALEQAGHAAGRPGFRGTMDDVAVDLAACPRHQAAEGEPCPRGGACPARRSAAAAAAARSYRPVEARRPELLEPGPLRELVMVKKYAVFEIAAIAGCSKAVVRQAMARHGIEP
jgi:hypothetical protein